MSILSPNATWMDNGGYGNGDEMFQFCGVDVSFKVW